ncbi:hypothetical protein ACIQNU_35855 [Streptomyces sp. NPDC091292]|uniref:hypothetical protein n=1 Tax=Streptomyces sp. NPDC091292 TaxID=3365991 RepID=UPI0038080B6F
MYLVPTDIGPLHPKVGELAVALPVFALCLFAVARAVPRLRRARARREDRTHGAARRSEAVRVRAERERAETVAVLAGAHGDAARARQRARETGAAPVAGARADGSREGGVAAVVGQAKTEARRAEVEAELRLTVSEVASDLAARMVGERRQAPEPRARG